MTGLMETIPGGLVVCLLPGAAPLTTGERATVAEYAQRRCDQGAAAEARYQGPERAGQPAAPRTAYEAEHAGTLPADTGTDEA